ncbi:MAG: HNH endonuclease [Brucellaceae bacterium]|jgi:hypothetical protein|nr:HNH endonuclease [Brucellaceae bacterium]
MADWPYNTTAWRKLRLAKLAADPLCYACSLRGLNKPARAVDHIHAIAKGGEPFPPLNRLMSLCISCHNSKTNAVDHSNTKGFGRSLKGFDLQGNPIDPADDWHGGGGTSNHQNGKDKRPGGKMGLYLVSDENNNDSNDLWFD